MWQIVYTKQAVKDIEKLKSVALDKNAKQLVDIIKQNPYQNPPRYEKLVGDLNGAYSRRINVQHRLIYEVIKEEKVIKILRMWTHYE